METIDFVGHPARMCSVGKSRKIVREQAVGERFLPGPLLNDLKDDRETRKQVQYRVNGRTGYHPGGGCMHDHCTILPTFPYDQNVS